MVDPNKEIPAYSPQIVYVMVVMTSDDDMIVEVLHTEEEAGELAEQMVQEPSVTFCTVFEKEVCMEGVWDMPSLLIH